MKKIIFAFTLLFTVALHGQDDEPVARNFSFYVTLFDLSSASQNIKKVDNLPHGYDELIGPKSVYFSIREHASFFWKQKLGVRAEVGWLARGFENGAFSNYFQNQFPDYYVPKYSRGVGYDYRFWALGLTYQFSKWRWHLAPWVQGGMGNCIPANYEGTAQIHGGNDLKYIDYRGPVFKAPNYAIGFDLFYEHTMSDRWGILIGATANWNEIYLAHTVTYSEQDSGQPEPVINEFWVDTKLRLVSGSFMIGLTFH